MRSARKLAVLASMALVIAASAQPWPIRHAHDHVQGLDADESWFWISAVDRRTKTGWIWRVDRGTLRTVVEREITDGQRYHPGGIQVAGDSLWVPLAEYRPHSTTRILELDRNTLRERSSFIIADHVGAVATDGRFVIGANWDARKFYRWTRRGKLLETVSNPEPLAIQDMKWVGGVIHAGGRVLGTEHPPCRVDRLDPAALRILGSWVPGQDRCYTREGLAHFRGRFFFLPEDEPNSRIYLVDAPP